MKKMKVALLLLLLALPGLSVAEESIDKLNIGCNRGVASDCTSLGLKYEYGTGVRLDEFKAAELYTKACDGGDSSGCLGLGNMYQFGRGVLLDKTKALQLYGKACDLKLEYGCKAYAIMKGRGY